MREYLTRARSAWGVLRVKVFNLNPGNPWRVIWSMVWMFLMALSASHSILAALALALLFGLKAMELFLMTTLADRWKQQCDALQTQLRAMEARAVRAEASQGGCVAGYQTRVESGAMKNLMALEMARARRNLN